MPKTFENRENQSKTKGMEISGKIYYIAKAWKLKLNIEPQ